MKDPAFLFYSSDFMTGISDLNMEERGQYITLLCLQHQKGHLSEKTIRLNVANLSEDVLSKFIKDDAGNYFNERLEIEINKRASFVDSRRNNGSLGGRPKRDNKKPLGKPIGLATQNLYEDVNVNDIIINKKIIEKDIINFQFNIEFKPLLLEWFEYKKQRKESYKSDLSKEKFYNKLIKFSGGEFEKAKQIIDNSMSNNWSGIFELKNNLPKDQPKIIQAINEGSNWNK